MASIYDVAVGDRVYFNLGLEGRVESPGKLREIAQTEEGRTYFLVVPVDPHDSNVYHPFWGWVRIVTDPKDVRKAQLPVSKEQQEQKFLHRGTRVNVILENGRMVGAEYIDANPNNSYHFVVFDSEQKNSTWHSVGSVGYRGCWVGAGQIRPFNAPKAMTLEQALSVLKPEKPEPEHVLDLRSGDGIKIVMGGPGYAGALMRKNLVQVNVKEDTSGKISVTVDITPRE